MSSGIPGRGKSRKPPQGQDVSNTPYSMGRAAAGLNGNVPYAMPHVNLPNTTPQSYVPAQSGIGVVNLTSNPLNPTAGGPTMFIPASVQVQAQDVPSHLATGMPPGSGVLHQHGNGAIMPPPRPPSHSGQPWATQNMVHTQRLPSMPTHQQNFGRGQAMQSAPMYISSPYPQQQYYSMEAYNNGSYYNPQMDPAYTQMQQMNPQMIGGMAQQMMQQPMTAPSMAPSIPHPQSSMQSMQPQHQPIPQQPLHSAQPVQQGMPQQNVRPPMVSGPPTAPTPQPTQPSAARRQRNVLAIVDPTTNETFNKDDVEKAKSGADVSDAISKETPSDAVEETRMGLIKSLQSTLTLDDSAPQQPAPAPAAEYKRTRVLSKCLLSDEQIKDLHLETPEKKDSIEPQPPVTEPISKEFTPTDLPTEEMPPTESETSAPEAISLDEHTCASSSVDKNTSGDSAICVQPASPTPPPDTPTSIAPPEIEFTPTIDEHEAVTVDTEGELTEPSTPAPVTPSMSETNTLAEEDEDAERALAAEEESRKVKDEMFANLEKLKEDATEVDVSAMVYGRTFLYVVRDLEKQFSVTECPLTPEELLKFEICRSQASSEPKKGGGGSFMPSWGSRQGGGGGPRDGGKKPYVGRHTDQSHHRPGGNRPGAPENRNRKIPATMRPSIERRAESNVLLHKATNAWKPEKVAKDDETDDAQKKVLLKSVRSLMNKITPTSRDALAKEFLSYDIPNSPALNEVIGIIFDKAVEEPKFCPLYAELCAEQVQEELHKTKNHSLFRNSILTRAQETFNYKTHDEVIAAKRKEIDEESDPKKKTEKEIQLMESVAKFRRRKFGNITFIGQLYQQKLLSGRIIHFCYGDLMGKIINRTENAPQDEESLDCAVRLLENIGKYLEKDVGPNTQLTTQIVNSFYDELEKIEKAGSVSSRIKFMIMNLLELRKNAWKARKTTDQGPKKLDEIKKDIQKEAHETAMARDQYERKTSRGGMGGGHGGMGPSNPKRGIIGRNSLDNRQQQGTPQDRRMLAGKSAALTSAVGTSGSLKKDMSLKKVERNSVGLGGSRKGTWASGASGGSSDVVRDEGRKEAVQAAAKIMDVPRSSSQLSNKDDEETPRSGTETGANSDDDPDRKEKYAKIAKSTGTFVAELHTGEINLEVCTSDILALRAKEAYGRPSTFILFKNFLFSALKENKSDLHPKFGLVLARCLQKGKDEGESCRADMLRGLAAGCADVVDDYIFEDFPNVWSTYAEILIQSIMVPFDDLEGSRAQLNDFREAFVAAAADDRKTFELTVTTLTRMAIINHEREPNDSKTMSSMMYEELGLTLRPEQQEKLTAALQGTKLAFGGNLHDFLMHE